MSAILGLFNIFTIFYIFRGLKLVAAIWRERQSIRQEPLTRHKKSLVEQASFFIAVPIGVFWHEVGHVLAVWASGGRVVKFGYRVFWGYVIPEGIFTPGQEWFISLAGTMGSLIFGTAVWLLLKNNSSSSLRYFGLRALRFQVFFSTIYYPVFTLLGFEGDWKTIYDFGATPLLSGVTIPFHAGLVLLFWWGDRTGWFERPSHETIAERDTFTAVQQQAALSPHDTQLQLQIIDALRQGGAVNTAKTKLKAFIRHTPDSGPAFLEMALLNVSNKDQISKKNSRYLLKALSLGLPNPASQAYAHQLLAKFYLDGNRLDEALHQINQALAQKSEAGETAVARHQATLYHLRSQIYRRQKQHQSAIQDIQQAINLVQQTNDKVLIGYYRDQLAIIKKQAGNNSTEINLENV